MGLSRLSMSLFWMKKPKAYLSYDKNTRALYERRGIFCENRTAAGYHSWMERVVSKVGDNFPQISLDAYQEYGLTGENGSELPESGTARLQEVPSETISRRYWTLSAGEGGEMWDEFHEHEIAAIGWDDLGDLSKFKDKEEIRLRLQEMWPSDSSKKNDALACWQFAHDISIGDIIFAKQGFTKLLGYGVVESDYSFEEQRPNYQHVHRVKWQSKGDWEIPNDSKMAMLKDFD